MKTKEQVIGSLEKALEELDITSSLRLPIIQTIEYLREEPVSEDLEEAAKRYATEGDEISGLYIIEPEVDAFKAGAEWQKQKDEKEKSDIYDIAVEVGRKLGEADMKQQMIKEAITGQLENGEDYLRIKCLYTSCRPLDDGKLVKLIIIKED